MTAKIFNNCMVCLELDYSFSYKRKKELRSKITENDGIISYIITKKVRQCLIVVMNNPAMIHHQLNDILNEMKL